MEIQTVWKIIRWLVEGLALLESNEFFRLGSLKELRIVLESPDCLEDSVTFESVVDGLVLKVLPVLVQPWELELYLFEHALYLCLKIGDVVFFFYVFVEGELIIVDLDLRLLEVLEMFNGLEPETGAIVRSYELQQALLDFNVGLGL